MGLNERMNSKVPSFNLNQILVITYKKKNNDNLFHGVLSITLQNGHSTVSPYTFLLNIVFHFNKNDIYYIFDFIADMLGSFGNLKM